MAYLLKTVETYRVGSEAEAKKLIEDAKHDGHFALVKYMTEDRCTKKKGEIEDEWKRVTLTKSFIEEKEPYLMVQIDYNTSGGGWEANDDN